MTPAAGDGGLMQAVSRRRYASDLSDAYRASRNAEETS
jgi:hypothetical protein